MREIKERQGFAGAHASYEGLWGYARGIGSKQGLRRTCPYPWLGERWTELLVVELASYGGGRISPERLKTTARGGSEGSSVSRQHQQIPNAPPKQLLELERHWSTTARLRGSLESSGWGDGQRPARPSFCLPTCSWRWCGVVLG